MAKKWKSGIQFITDRIHDQELTHGVRLDEIIWEKLSGNTRHMVEVTIRCEKKTGTKRFSRDQLFHSQLENKRNDSVYANVLLKIESLFLQLER